MRRAVYAGSFDPPTNGHLFLLREGARLFDELVVAVAINPAKQPLFSLDERLALLRTLSADLPTVRVERVPNQYLVQYAASLAVSYLLRGLRSGADFAYERTLHHMNLDIEPRVTTVYLMPTRALAETTAAFVKGLIGPAGWPAVVGRLVTPPVLAALLARFPPNPAGDAG